MKPIVEIREISKSYASGTTALSDVSLDIMNGEILALLGPNGAGKTTLISAICGLVEPSSGQVTVGGHNISSDYRKARSLIGLVPQEISVEPFETVMNTVRFSRGLFGKRKDDAYLEQVLKSLSLWEKRDAKNVELSGGMKRRVLIAKALSHEPKVLFLDEPSAGVDVGLRREMWALVRKLREDGVTIILTTHYIEEAEEMADRIGVINKGKLLVVKEKAALMQEFGRKHLTIDLRDPLAVIPKGLEKYDLALAENGLSLTYTYDTRAEHTGIGRLLKDFSETGLSVADLVTEQSSLEEVFLHLVGETA